MSRAAKILLILASIPLLFLSTVVVVLAAPTVGTGLTFRAASVSIQEHHPGGTHLSFPVPAVVLDGGLRLAIASGALDDMEPLPPEVVEMLPALGEAARALAEAPDHTLVLVNGKRRHRSALLGSNGAQAPDLAFEIRPAGQSVLARQRELDVPERGRGRRNGVRPPESRERVRIGVAQLLQPALRLPPEVLERAAGREFPAHRPSSHAPVVR